MMKNKVQIFVLVLYFVVPVQSQTERSFFNPGVKIGYVFGPSGGSIGGIECSYSRTKIDTHTRSSGVVVSIDWNREIFKFHCGAEYYYDGLGLEWGPSFLRKSHQFDVTTSATFLCLDYCRSICINYF